MKLKTRAGEIEVAELGEPVPTNIQDMALTLMDLGRTEEVYAALGHFYAEAKAQVLRGKVALCSKGRVGLITGYKRLPWGWSYTGVLLWALEGEGEPTWAARDPKVVAESYGEWLDGYLEAQEQHVMLLRGCLDGRVKR